ncbi:MAG: hypothetical protein ABIP63_09945 [Thermoanaerobaculia bacterium]
MRVIRDQPYARWFPSRRRFALTKILALVFLKTLRSDGAPAPSDAAGGERIVLGLDRDHDSFEIYSAASLHFVVLTCFMASFIPLPPPLSILLAAFFEPLLALLLCFAGALVMSRWAVLRGRSRVSFAPGNSVVLMALAIAASVYLLGYNGWAAPVGGLFLTIVIINAIASLAVRFLQPTIARLEERCVA